MELIMEYVLYRNHSGLIIATKYDYDDMRTINAALESRTWGEFLDHLPTRARREVLDQEDIAFGPGLRPHLPIDPDDLDGQPLIERGTAFDPTLIPGFSSGDWPNWPAEEFSHSDEICEQAFRLFGSRGVGFMQTFWNIREDAVDDLRRWLIGEGHSLLEKS